MPEENNFIEQLGKLIALQEIDSELFDVQSQLEEIPERIKEMDDSLASKMGGMQAAEEELKRLKVLKNEKETDMQAMEEKIAKHEGDLYQIKNNKEYQALQQEIDSIKADVSLVEGDIIQLFDDIAAAEEKGAEEKKIFEVEKQQSDKEKQALNAETSELKKKQSEFENKREEYASSVDAEILRKYKQVLASRGKTALAPINDGFCGECNMQLRPQIINEAQLKKDIVSCENCSRILYVKD